MTWFRFTRKGPWHAFATLNCRTGDLVASCRYRTRWPADVRDNDPLAGEPRCKVCVKRLEAKP